jgi:hypothetical protein
MARCCDVQARIPSTVKGKHDIPPLLAEPPEQIDPSIFLEKAPNPKVITEKSIPNTRHTKIVTSLTSLLLYWSSSSSNYHTPL